MDNASTPLRQGALPVSDIETAIAYVRALQRDGRLLLRHVARRADRALAAAAPGAGVGSLALSVLTADPAMVARDKDMLGALATCVDALSRQAAPATATTIRLTQSYLRSSSDGADTTPEVENRAFWLRFWIKGIMVAALFAVLFALALLAHVDDGRRGVQQLQENRAELHRIYAQLADRPAAAWLPVPATSTPAAFRGYCELNNGRVPADTAEGGRAQALCQQAIEASLRNDLVLMRLANWNCRINNIANMLPGQLGGDCSQPPGDSTGWGSVKPRDWERTEIRTAAAISTMTGFLLPLMMGFIGGCAFVLRRLDQRLSENTLEARDGWHAVLRVLLATMLGGLLGVVWSSDQPVQLGGFTLTLAAAAFFVGFALEAVFTVIEAMVEGVAGKLRGPAAAPTIVLAASPAPPAAPPAEPPPPPPPTEPDPPAPPAEPVPPSPPEPEPRQPEPATASPAR